MKRYNAAGVCAALSLGACATSPSAPAPEAAAPIPVAPVAPVYVVGDIMNATAASIDALLGPAALSREEGDGEYRRYSLSECGLVVILYPDEQGARRAAHVEATALSSAGEKPALEACLAAG